MSIKPRADTLTASEVSEVIFFPSLERAVRADRLFLLFAKQVTTSGPHVSWTQRDPLGITEMGRGIYDSLGNYIPFQQMADPRPPIEGVGQKVYNRLGLTP